jgi:hypothetical protein
MPIGTRDAYNPKTCETPVPVPAATLDSLASLPEENKR